MNNSDKKNADKADSAAESVGKPAEKSASRAADAVKLSCGGFAMALADSVPGVSGGTIAFLLGFYDRFIGSIADLVSRDGKKRVGALKFLLVLGIGWVVGMVGAILVLTAVFESHIYSVSSLFIGFILFSIPVIVKEEAAVLLKKYYNMLFIIPGAALVVCMTVFGSGTAGEAADLAQFSLPGALYLALAGACAISAMVLPGISGSTLLLVFGVYLPVLKSVKELMHLNFAPLPMIVFFIVGAVVGALLFVRLLRFTLNRFRAQTVYTVLGMMLGSFYSIVMGPTSLDTPLPQLSFANFDWLFFIVGAAIIVAMQVGKYVMGRRSTKGTV